MSSRTTHRLAALLATSMFTGLAAPALAQTALDEVVVTAQKRSENLQDVPVSVQALGAERLDELQVTDMADYARFLPNVTIQTAAPGFSTIYMRGVASGENNNHSGPLPSVAVYLDEQPVTTITGPLDIHVYDIERVEVLSGPQGTLYGASAQAGTIRIITKKPSPAGFEAGYDLDLNKFSHSDVGYGFEGFVNQPVGELAAVRLVAWAEHDGGYIDNVPGTLTYPIGIPPDNLGPVTVNNNSLVEDDYNEVDIYGARAALKIDLNENWSIMPTLNAQRTEADGNFSYDPGKGDLKVSRYRPERSDDKWVQAALTIEGAVSDLDLVYAGALMKRWVDTESDYSDYSYFYDTLAGYGVYWLDNAGNPHDITQYIQGKDAYKKQSHEFRVSTPVDRPLRVTMGAFYQRQTHNIQQRYKIDALADDLEVPGWPDTIWLTKQLRVDRDYAAFMDASFDVSEKFSLNAGIRFFKAKNSLQGFFGFGEGYSGGTGVAACFKDTAIVKGGPCTNVDKTTEDNGNTYRLNAQYEIDDDRMIYVTYSTGYRPGGINRRGTLPPYESDYLKNLEFGWKTMWLENRLRWNGAAYLENWDDFQFSFLGANGLTEIRNAGKAKMLGIESDLSWAVTDGLTINAAGAYTDAELDEDYAPDPDAPPEAEKGTSLPVTSEVPRLADRALRVGRRRHGRPPAGRRGPHGLLVAGPADLRS
ncbi:TonB-dependent receptor [Phenylobacterium sp. J367]|uniref:TonB-dependent receptor n=1 Tax=Phenylobacterium sp. J367 TaxID=2898435 RepID=UPI0027E39FC6|nr:TonB-dependent receptor [Phenylobacterium sp. J367]